MQDMQAASHAQVEDVGHREDRREKNLHGFSPRSKRIAVLTPLALMLVLWLWLFAAEGAFSHGPNGKTFEADFAMFVGAAKVLENHGNPYDRPTLYGTESAMLRGQGIREIAKRTVVRVGNPPLFYWLLKPVSRLPFKWTALAWMGLLYAASAAGFLALIRHFGWTKWLLPLVLFLLMPQVAFGPFYGNGVDLLFAATAFAIVTASRYPYAAGALLACLWLKPPLGLPIVLLVLLFQTPHRRESLVGFIGASALGAAATTAVAGPANLVHWLHGLMGYTSYVHAAPDIATLSGLYNVVPAAGARLAFAILTSGAALVLTAMVWHRRKRIHPTPVVPDVAFLPIAWLWLVWFLAIPYAHFYDEILLIIPILPLLGRDGTWVARREATAALYAFFASLLFVSANPFGLQFLWVPLIAILLCLFVAGRSPRYVLARVQAAH